MKIHYFGNTAGSDKHGQGGVGVALSRGDFESPCMQKLLIETEAIYLCQGILPAHIANRASNVRFQRAKRRENP